MPPANRVAASLIMHLLVFGKVVPDRFAVGDDLLPWLRVVEAEHGSRFLMKSSPAPRSSRFREAMVVCCEKSAWRSEMVAYPFSSVSITSFAVTDDPPAAWEAKDRRKRAVYGMKRQIRCMCVPF